ncbi:hypothetical protein [Helicobacter pylori]|uniref:hypothetical protein n=1 Tax=Helicobacter pylori TaxID=210 RepID=UPI0018E9FC22|nr:hypothetical protein [Helicobacter pylori]
MRLTPLALNQKLYFTTSSYDWHEIYFLYERAIPSIKLNVLDFYAVCFRDDYQLVFTFQNSKSLYQSLY